MSYNFLFTELGEGKVFDGMASGKFTDFSGQTVEIKAEDLPAIVEKTKLAIASTTTESGEVVGLPIDEDGHNHKGGAGWITDVSMDESGKKIRFVPNWTEIGLELIGKKIRRFFSVSVDLANQVILGGSLTNWPATRTKDGQILLRPIELSTELFEIQEKPMDTTFVKTGFQKIADDITNFIASLKGDDEPPKGEQEMALPTPPVAPELPSPSLTELLKTPEAVKEMGQKAVEMAQEFVKAEMRKKEIVEFAATLVGGSKDSPYGLPVRADEVVALLLSLPSQQSQAVQMLLTKTMKATVNFMESGFSGEFNAHQRLPEAFRPALQTWLSAGNDIKSFFAQNAELGSAEDYNLAEFVKEK